MAEDIDTRLAAEVASLSTKLVTEVARLLLLEETAYQLRRENHALKKKIESLLDIDNAYNTLNTRYKDLSDSHTAITEEKRLAQEKNAQLEAEVEDLTASLFNEANEMVSSASRETYNFKVKNRKLIEELSEKDIIILDLQSQLQDLKTLFQEMDDENKLREASAISTPFTESNVNTEKNRFSGAFERRLDELDQLVYCPRARSIRFDLQVYQRDFRGFIYQLCKPDFAFDLSSLKTLRYFRKIWTEEIEPSLGNIPTPTGTFINRWSMGKSFWSYLVEGKARIEPVSGVNETFRLSYKGAKTGLEVPIALKEPCEFCGEHNESRLEYARLYNLKLYSPAKDSRETYSGSVTDIGGESHHLAGLYPLCNYCLVKLRAICEFFAKLRVIHSNIYKISPNSLFNDTTGVSSFQFKRSTESLVPPKVNIEDEPILVKLYLLLLGIRAKIYWSRAGFWDTDEDVECLNIEEIKLDVFREFVSTNVSFQESQLEVVALTPKDELISNALATSIEVEKTNEIGMGSKETEGGSEKQEHIETGKVSESIATAASNENVIPIEPKPNTADNGSPEKEEEEDNKLSEEVEFHDSVEKTEPPVASISRKKSRSKAFKKKMNRDLDNTIEMLKENLG